MLPERLRRLLPEPHALREHRALRWIGPALHHPRLWRVNRRGIALGVAIGVFIGFLIPVAQMATAASAALLLRANIPAAVGGTWVTNPFTFAPFCYLAYWLGSWMLGGTDAGPGFDLVAGGGDLAWWLERVLSLGAPIGLGLLTLAVGLSLLTYLAVHWGWRLRIARAWKRRAASRRGRA
jgi:uncharacterized protein (DUF2062 family)